MGQPLGTAAVVSNFCNAKRARDALGSTLGTTTAGSGLEEVVGRFGDGVMLGVSVHDLRTTSFATRKSGNEPGGRTWPIWFYNPASQTVGAAATEQ